MPRKAVATAAGLVAMLIERSPMEGDAIWAILAALALYLLCHTVTDVASMVFKEERK
jgi:hypothetical protein